MLEDGKRLAAEDGRQIFFHSVPDAVPMYSKAGFRELERISMEFDEKDAQGEIAERGLIELVAMTQ